ncbi:NifU family protein [Leptolyngbya ohadii]|uniref:NifU family protein n=1 Tax=Leptolyngbya ohadii TaxID=1962290 RepID=UPI0019D44A58|nr:NifU family protein [Leptolyngbya ohadii]
MLQILGYKVKESIEEREVNLFYYPIALMVQAPSPTDHSVSTLDGLIADINQFEAIANHWDDAQRATVSGLKRSIEALHREALVRLIRSVKQESMSALRQAIEDEVVYSVLRYHDLVKPPQPPLEYRLQQALEAVRPGLQSHSGDIELVAIKLPDTVEVRLTGTCSHCPAATLTLTDGVEQTIRRYCPEITRVVAVRNDVPNEATDDVAVSSCQSAASIDSGWLEVTSLAEVPIDRVLAMKLEGRSILLSRIESFESFKSGVVCYQNACSHLGVSLEDGAIESGVLVCPHHGFRYRLATGECLTSPEMPLQSYPVEVRDGQVFVKLWD